MGTTGKQSHILNRQYKKTISLFFNRYFMLKEYMAEGINVNVIEYIDNRPVLVFFSLFFI